MDATAGGGGKGGGGSGLNLHVRSDPKHRAIIHGTVEEEEEEEDDGHVCNPVMGKNGSNFPPHVAVVACSPFLLLETEEEKETDSRWVASHSRIFISDVGRQGQLTFILFCAWAT